MKHCHNMKNMRKKCGIVLTVELVAIGMISVGVLILSSVINSAVSTTKMSRGYLVAQNLVTEGIEAVKNIRSTNWLTASDDRTCWLRTDPMQACDTSGIIADTAADYILENTDGEWLLVESPTAPLDLRNQGPDYSPYNIFTGSLISYVSVGDGIDPTPYYRSIRFKNIDIIGNDFAEFEVLVQWKDGSKVREVSRTLTIYNYL